MIVINNRNYKRIDIKFMHNCEIGELNDVFEEYIIPLFRKEYLNSDMQIYDDDVIDKYMVSGNILFLGNDVKSLKN
jgi:hypothetical protein